MAHLDDTGVLRLWRSWTGHEIYSARVPGQLRIAIDVLRGGEGPAGLLWLAAAVVFGLNPIYRAWGGHPPFRWGSEGIEMVDVEDGIGQRLLPWSQITSVVLFRSGRQMLFGLRLAGQPDDGVHLVRTLAGWGVDPAALGAEVARFGARLELDPPTGAEVARFGARLELDPPTGPSTRRPTWPGSPCGRTPSG